MPDPSNLRAEARLALAGADNCRLLADQIEVRRRLVAARVEPACRAHRPEVWSSLAAERSRDQLTRYVAPALWYVSSDLAATAARLRDAARDLDARARGLLTDAAELEAAAIEAAASASSIAADALDAPLGSTVPAVLDR